VRAVGTLVVNEEPRDAAWTDMIQGEQVADFLSVDIGKLQMLVITAVVAFTYLAALARMFQNDDGSFISTLPPVTQGMNVLLGISHAGYLATKSQAKPSQAP
jgi:hypothetical protein